MPKKKRKTNLVPPVMRYFSQQSHPQASCRRLQQKEFLRIFAPRVMTNGLCCVQRHKAHCFHCKKSYNFHREFSDQPLTFTWEVGISWCWQLQCACTLGGWCAFEFVQIRPSQFCGFQPQGMLYDAANNHHPQELLMSSAPPCIPTAP